MKKIHVISCKLEDECPHYSFIPCSYVTETYSCQVFCKKDNKEITIFDEYNKSFVPSMLIKKAFPGV